MAPDFYNTKLILDIVILDIERRGHNSLPKIEISDRELWPGTGETGGRKDKERAPKKGQRGQQKWYTDRKSIDQPRNHGISYVRA